LTIAGLYFGGIEFKMPASFHEILNSRLFKFTVGEEVDGRSSEFFVHEAAVAQLTKPLHALTKGSSSEARAGSATWKGISSDTFERFTQFAYTGDYSIPRAEKRSTPEKTEINGHNHPSSPKAPNGIPRRNGSEASASTSEPHDRPAPVLDNESVSEKVDDDGTILNYPSFNKNSKKSRKKKNKTGNQVPAPEPGPEPEVVEPDPSPAPESTDLEVAEPEQLELQQAETEQEPTPIAQQEKLSEQLSPNPIVDFHSLSYPTIAQRDNYHGTCEPSTDFDKDNDYSKVLLSHASLYVLGDFQLINSLKALALFKLHKTLCAFQLGNENIGDITRLARYAYAEGGGKGSPQEEEGIKGLRALVCQYLAIHAVELSLDVRFMDLLAGGGQIVKDFFRFQLQRGQ